MELNIINTLNKKQKEESDIIVCDINNTITDLKNIIINNLGIKYIPERIGLYYIKKDINNPSKNIKENLTNLNRTIRDYDLTNNTTIYVKDLGPQISWRLTYVIEYVGPLLIIIYFFLKLNPYKANTTQIIGFIMSTFHFSKRIIESIFVHKFSNSTMPLKNLFINCTYYWIIYGILCGYTLFNENYVQPSYSLVVKGLLVFLFWSAEIKNLRCHLILKELKDKNKGEKGIPDGEGYEFVSCAHYFWEFLAWLFFSILVNLLTFYFFTLCGFLILRSWAIKRHKEYRKTFGDKYPKGRKAFIPFLI